MDWDEEYSRANKFRISHMGPKTWKFYHCFSGNFAGITEELMNY